MSNLPFCVFDLMVSIKEFAWESFTKCCITNSICAAFERDSRSLVLKKMYIMCNQHIAFVKICVIANAKALWHQGNWGAQLTHLY